VLHDPTDTTTLFHDLHSRRPRGGTNLPYVRRHPRTLRISAPNQPPQAVQVRPDGTNSGRFPLAELRRHRDRSFLCETSLALTGQRTAHDAHRAGSSAAHSAMSR